MENSIKLFLEKLITLGERLITVAIVIFVGFKLVKLLIKLIKKGKSYNKLEKSVQTFLISFISIALKIIILVIAANILGIPIASIIAVIGSAGLAIGLALQGGLSNIAGGLMILIFKPFQVGHYIATGTVEGTVTDITMFYTKLHTLDNKIITIPNSTLSSATVINYTAVTKRRVDLDFSVSYDSNMKEVKKIINDVLKKQKTILENEEKFVRLTSHAESALIYTVRVWCKTENYWELKYDLTEQIKEALDKANIKIPYPQLDVHINK